MGRTDVIGGLPMPRIVLIDYNQAIITSPSSDSPPASPAAIAWSMYLWDDFPGWVPNEWAGWDGELVDGVSRFKVEWLVRRFPEDTAQLLQLCGATDIVSQE